MRQRSRTASITSESVMTVEAIATPTASTVTVATAAASDTIDPAQGVDDGETSNAEDPEVQTILARVEAAKEKVMTETEVVAENKASESSTATVATKVSQHEEGVHDDDEDDKSSLGDLVVDEDIGSGSGNVVSQQTFDSEKDKESIKSQEKSVDSEQQSSTPIISELETTECQLDDEDEIEKRSNESEATRSAESVDSASGNNASKKESTSSAASLLMCYEEDLPASPPSLFVAEATVAVSSSSSSSAPPKRISPFRAIAIAMKQSINPHGATSRSRFTSMSAPQVRVRERERMRVK